MIKNYLKLALRNLWKNKTNAGINLFGLTIGLACCLLIALYIGNELSYDRFHPNADRTYRVTRAFLSQNGEVNLHLPCVSPPFGPLLMQDFPEIEKMTRLLQNPYAFRVGENQFNEQNVFYADPDLFEVFSVPVVSGDPKTALEGPFQIMLSEKTAQKYFGSENPVDRTLRADNRLTFRVTGVFRDLPPNSHVHPDFLASFSTLNDTTVYGAEQLRTNWSNNSFFTYFLLPQHLDPDKIAAQFPAFLDKNMPVGKRKPSERTQLFLQKLTDIHLRSHLDDELEANGDSRRVWIFASIALFILLIACINYMNLSTAFSMTRAREIGVRKTAGAKRSQIIGQFLSESVLLALLAAVLAVALVAFALPLLKNSIEVALPADMLFRWQFLAALFACAILTGVLAGLYPAFFLSSFNPLKVLKSATNADKSSISLRKVLVVAQFSISIFLIVGTAMIYRQLDYMRNKNLGLEKDRVITYFQNASLTQKWDAFRAELLANPQVENVGRSSRIPSGRLLDDLGGTSAQIADTMTASSATLKFVTVDYDFVPTYGIQLAAGRNFSRDFPTDTTEGFLINEAASRAIGWKTPEDAVGKRLSYGGRNNARIVGVLRDFHFESLHQHIVPMIFFLPRNPAGSFGYGSVKLGGGNIPAALAHVEATWKKFVPDFPFQYKFADDSFGKLYEAEQRQGKLFTLFAVLAVLIACLGLFGLVTFTAHRRIKEIGIRKVLGASVTNITALLASDFVKLVLVAFVLVTPVAYYAMDRWLEGFAYRVSQVWWVFAMAGGLAVVVALLTVSFQSIKAALVNPVKSLRSE